MEKIYRTFKLLGYKVNDLPNGCFIVKQPNGVQSLFDKEGRIIKGNFSRIKQLSDILYFGSTDEIDKDTLFDCNSNIVEQIDTNKGCIDICINCVKVFEEDKQRITIYDKNLKSKIVIYDTEDIGVYNFIEHNCKCSVLFRDSSNHIKLADTDGNIKDMNFSFNEYENANNHYIVTRNGNSVVMDYKGNIINNCKKAYIDTVNKDNDTIVTVKDKRILVSSIDREIHKVIDVEDDMYNIKFTSNMDVIILVKPHGAYALNIKTNKRTIDYERIIQNMGILHKNLYILDFETLEGELKIEDIDNLTVRDRMIQVEHKNRVQYYTLDFKPLIHEFI